MTDDTVINNKNSSLKQDNKPEREASRPLKDATKTRLTIRANGWTPIRNRDKATYMKGWPDVEVTVEEIMKWDRIGRDAATGIRVENGLAVVDIDIDDEKIVGAIFDAFMDIVPELDSEDVPWLERHSGRAKVAWFFRTDEPFGKLKTATFVAPGYGADDPDAPTGFLEIFGGGSARQFGAFGSHSFDEHGNVVREYGWRDRSPLDTRLDELPVVTKAQFVELSHRAAEMLKAAGWTIQPLTKFSDRAGGREFDLTEDMVFDCNDGATRSLTELAGAAAAADAGRGDGLRCSMSWKEGPQAKNRTRGLVGLTRGGLVFVHDTQDAVTHLPKPVEHDMAKLAKLRPPTGETDMHELAGARIGGPSDRKNPPGGYLLPPPTAPFDVAQAFVATVHMEYGPLTLRHWRGGWWLWADTHWKTIRDKTIYDQLYRFTATAYYKDAKGAARPWMPNEPKVRHVLHALQSVCRLDDATEPGSWLDGRRAGRVIACKNGLLDIAARELHEHSPLFFNLNSLPFDYDPSARCPEFDKFVASIWPDDPETRCTLAQMLGYLVSGRTDLQCVFGLIGPSRAGKGVIARLATALIGQENTTALHLSSFGEQFGLSNLVGKALAVLSDVRTAGKGKAEAVERLLSITGEDAVQVGIKHKDPWVGRMTARILYQSNEVPYLGDASGAVAGRFVMLPFSRSFVGQEDRTLADKLLAELPGILNLALDGLAELDRQGGRFAQSAAALELKQDTADLSSPMKEFLREECDIAPGYRVEKRAAYQRYRHWAQDTGHPPLSESVFARNLFAAGGGLIGKVRGRDGDERVQLFTGFRLRQNASASVAERAASLAIKTVKDGRNDALKPDKPDPKTLT